MVMTGLCDREEVKTPEGFIFRSHCSEVMHRSHEVGGLLPLPSPVPALHSASSQPCARPVFCHLVFFS